MTITVTPDITSDPPKNTVAMSSPVGSVQSAVQVWRIVDGVQTLLRQQPAPGFDSRTVEDFECPYGVSAVYGWETTYTTGLASVWSEAWASTAAWSNDTSLVNVSGGTVRNNGTGFATITRTVPNGNYRYTIASMTSTSSAPPSITLHRIAGMLSEYIDFECGTSTGGLMQISYGGLGFPIGSVASSIVGSSPVVVDCSETGITVTGLNGSGGQSIVTIARSGNFDRVDVNFTGGTANTSAVGAIAVQAYTTPVTLTEEAAPVVLDSVDAWFIHPASVGKSFPIRKKLDGYRLHSAASIRSIDPVANSSNTTVHKILGSATPVTTTNGDRAADETGITVATATADEAAALNALLLDETPLLLNFPPAAGLDLPYGFYQVGDVTHTRRMQKPGEPSRDHYLPLTAVQSPLVDQESTGWSYAQLALDFTSYANEIASFATYADLRSNTRS